MLKSTGEHLPRPFISALGKSSVRIWQRPDVRYVEAWTRFDVPDEDGETIGAQAWLRYGRPRHGMEQLKSMNCPGK